MAGLSKTDKMLFGTCGALSELTGINSNIFRIAFVVMLFCYGMGIGLYVLLTLIFLILGANNNQGKS